MPVLCLVGVKEVIQDWETGLYGDEASGLPRMNGSETPHGRRGGFDDPGNVVAVRTER